MSKREKKASLSTEYQKYKTALLSNTTSNIIAQQQKIDEKKYKKETKLSLELLPVSLLQLWKTMNSEIISHTILTSPDIGHCSPTKWEIDDNLFLWRESKDKKLANLI